MKEAFLLLFIGVAACELKPKEVTLKEKIEPILRIYTTNLFGRIDSLVIFKIDTLTSSQIEYYKTEQYISKTEEIMSKLELQKSELSLYRTMAEFSHTATNIRLFEEKRDEVKKMIAEMNEYDSLMGLHLERQKVADSTDFNGYIARFRLKYSDSTTMVQETIDNAEVIITPDFKIREKKAFIEN